MTNFSDLNETQFNIQDVDPTGDFERKLAEMKKKDRIKMLATGFAVGLMLTIGVVTYMYELNPASATDSLGSYQSGTNGSYAGYSTQYAINSGSSGTGAGIGGAGGCCGGGGGAGGGAIGSASLPDLEKQGLAKYKEEKGDATDVKAKATNFGCHIQIDISDSSGKVVRSYGYQGSSLYVIK